MPKELTPEQLEKITVRGRAQALEAILNTDAEEFIDLYTYSSAIADTGDYSTEWKSDELIKLFDVNVDQCKQAPHKKLMDVIDSMYWEQVAKRDDFDCLKKLVRDLVGEIDRGKINKGDVSALAAIRTWI